MCRLTALLVMGVVACSNLTAAPVLRWLTTEHDFGAFDESLGVVNCVFEAVNVGDEPAIVYTARANCGCTTPHYDKHAVAPADTLCIEVGYNAEGRPGRFEKSVTVTTNAVPAKAVLHITGTVIGSSETLRTRYPFSNGNLKLRQNHINFGDVARGNSRSMYIEGYNQSDSLMVPVVTGVPKYMDITVKPDTVPPGETFVVSAILQSAACPVWDIVTDTITLSTKDGSTLPITTIANIYDDFRGRNVETCALPALEISPATVDLGRVKVSGDDNPLSYDITLKNRSKKPVVLRRVYTLSPGIRLNIKGKDTIKPGKKCVVEVKIDPLTYTDRKFIDAKILIITDDPAHPRNVVEVLGEIVKIATNDL